MYSLRVKIETEITEELGAETTGNNFDSYSDLEYKHISRTLLLFVDSSLLNFYACQSEKKCFKETLITSSYQKLQLFIASVFSFPL